MQNNISFIIQGEVLSHINYQVAEIRKYFPQSEIIVSTCNDFNIEIIGADQIIKSEDPGFFYYSARPGEKVNNINRQIVSTLAGLKACKTKYTFKLRSDFILTGSEFMSFFDNFPKTEKAYQVFEHKILSCCFFARNPKSDMPFPFHPSDICFFGLTSDLINLFNIPLMTKEEAFWDTTNAIFNRYVPEQHLFINCLKKNQRSVLCHYYDNISEENIVETERYFASNFIFLDFEQFCIQPTKQTFNMKIHPNAFRSCYTHNEWQVLYKKYIDNTLSVPEADITRLQIEHFYKNYKKYRFLSNLLALPFRDKAKRREIRNKTLEYFLAR